MNGTAFSMAAVFALGVQPYINSSIIIELLTVAIPALERLAKEGGEEGRKKIAAITRYTTVAIALLQGFGYYSIINSQNLIELDGMNAIWAGIVIVTTFVAGSAFVMWLGEQITDKGIGNGISMILFAGILSRMPTLINQIITGVQQWMIPVTDELVEGLGGAESEAYGTFMASRLHPAIVAVMVVGMLALIMFVVYIQNAERRIPVQYAKRVVGRKMYGVQPYSPEGEYVRRASHHLCPVHRLSARHHLRLRRCAGGAARSGGCRLLGQLPQDLRRQRCSLHHRLLPADFGLQLLLFHHAV
jgi:preprotein translocase subunit SecY